MEYVTNLSIKDLLIIYGRGVFFTIVKGTEISRMIKMEVFTRLHWFANGLCPLHIPSYFWMLPQSQCNPIPASKRFDKCKTTFTDKLFSGAGGIYTSFNHLLWLWLIWLSYILRYCCHFTLLCSMVSSLPFKFFHVPKMIWIVKSNVHEDQKQNLNTPELV